MLNEKPWKPELVLRFLAGLFASIFLGILLVNLLVSHSPLEPAGDKKFFSLVIVSLSFHGAIFLLVTWLLQEHQLSWSEAFGFQAPRLGRTLLLALVAGVVVLPLSWLLSKASAEVMTWFQLQPVRQQSVQTLESTESLPQSFYFALVAIVAAPAAEELLFRGVLYPALKQRGYPRLAIWGTSILFAATHGNLMTFVPLIFLAVVLTVLYEITNNLLAPIMTHSFFNLANFLLIIWERA